MALSYHCVKNSEDIHGQSKDQKISIIDIQEQDKTHQKFITKKIVGQKLVDDKQEKKD
jgi:hypothetical protein